MNTFDAIKERRSVKHYDPDHKLTDEEVINYYHWQFYHQHHLIFKIGDLW